MNFRQSSTACRLLICASLLAACSADDGSATPAPDSGVPLATHDVYFVGYLYNGATGTRLTAAQITSVMIKYRDKVIETKVESDGRFVTQTPLPTWQDYAVYAVAPGFRTFVSRNTGIDVPASLAMTEALGGTRTVQTFQVQASLFPTDLKSPKVTLTIDQADAAVTMPPAPRASGTVRLRPQSTSALEVGSGQTATGRRWFNDEDLVTQTVTKPFTDGKVDVLEGELVYGVAYQVTVFGVAGYQPVILPEPLVSGQVSSRTIVINKELRDPLRILSLQTDGCIPPAGNASEPGAAVHVDFSEPAEFANATAAEDIDNGVSVVPGSGSSFSHCPLKTSISPTVQERGTKAVIAGTRLTLTFTPSVGFAMSSPGGFTCTIPTSLAAVTYGSLSLVSVRPVGDPTRKRNLAEMLVSYYAANGISSSSSSLTCGSRTTSF